jgi:2-polyprenyl-3-methyl-5-hydroxy-6-metoxy-1,4-benzoquinol methylase
MTADLYAGAGGRWRILQSLRPYICPFDAVFAQVPAQAELLDVGCGAGMTLILLAKLGRVKSGYGFDVSPPAIAAARQAASLLPEPGRVSFELRSVEAGLPDVAWTAATVIDVIHHIPRRWQEAFVRDLASRVPPGGRLIIKDMVKKPRWRAAMNTLHDLLLARQRVQHVELETVMGWAMAEGLSAVHSSRLNRFWYGHWLAVFDRPKSAL